MHLLKQSQRKLTSKQEGGEANLAKNGRKQLQNLWSPTEPALVQGQYCWIYEYHKNDKLEKGFQHAGKIDYLSILFQYQLIIKFNTFILPVIPADYVILIGRFQNIIYMCQAHEAFLLSPHTQKECSNLFLKASKGKLNILILIHST